MTTDMIETHSSHTHNKRHPIQTFLLQSREMKLEAYAALMPHGRVYVQHITGMQKLECYSELVALMAEMRSLQSEIPGAILYYTKFHLETYRLHRAEDITGISGTGTVAHGVVFPTANVVQQWNVEPYGIGLFDNIEDMLTVHGHEGRTKAIFY